MIRIPAVQEKLGLGEGLLGVSLLGAGVGALVAMPLTGALTSRFGSRPVVGATALMLPVALVLPALAPGRSPWWWPSCCSEPRTGRWTSR
ncbi:MAG TPA: hypothetical protein VFE21_04380 [Rubrobacteraceae bacterium]|nr:hypothetical protein [Rubrobacteraceae bacterium]